MKRTFKSFARAAIRIALAIAVSGAVLSCGRAAELGGYQDAPTSGKARAESFADGAAAPASDRAPSPAPASSEPAPAEPAPQAVSAERKLVRTAYLRLRVESLEAGEKAATAIVAGLKGYVASTNASEYSVSMTLRVPQAAFDAALSSLEPLGKALARNLSAEDVTLRYYDLAGRIETKRALAEKYREYLKRASSIDDLLAVEARLADLQYEIERLGTEFKGLADLVDFATITLELTPPPSELRDRGPSFGDRITGVFKSFGSFLSVMAAGLVALVIFGIPAVAVLATLFWLLFGRIGLLVKLFRLVAKPRTSGKAREA